MDCNNIKNVKLNLAISQDAACAVLDSLVRAIATTPSVHDNNVLIDYINKQELLDNYPDGDFDSFIGHHMSKLQAAYDCCTVALELYEALEDSRNKKSDEEPGPESKLPEVSNQVSTEKPAPENKLPEGSIKVVFKIYVLTCYKPEAEVSIIWDMNNGGLAHCPTSNGICRFSTRQDLMDCIIRILTPAQSLKEYAESNEHTAEEKELVRNMTRKLMTDLGAPPSEDYSGELIWECVNS
jgi:hypothetical protein